MWRRSEDSLVDLSLLYRHCTPLSAELTKLYFCHLVRAVVSTFLLLPTRASCLSPHALLPFSLLPQIEGIDFLHENKVRATG